MFDRYRNEKGTVLYYNIFNEDEQLDFSVDKITRMLEKINCGLRKAVL